jgi:hypothetical protein
VIDVIPLPDPQYTGGTLATVICVPILLLALNVAAVWLIRRDRAENAEERTYSAKTGGDFPPWYDRGDVLFYRLGWIATTVATVALLAGTWWGMYPWRAEYHQWRPIEGIVDRVDSRIVPAGDSSVEQKIVVLFRDNPQQYGVLDTRAAGAHPGDRLAITCVRRWQYSGSDGYDCEFVGLVRVP